MTLFLVLAADAISMALVSGRQRYLVYAGVWVGIAFQAKMLEAWLVLPAFGLAYLLGREDRWGHKLRQVAIAGLVAAVVSLSWMTAVTLTPAHDRPYVDGSQNNSVYQQVFVYDGFGRSGQQPAFQGFLGGIHLSPEVRNGPSPAWNRLLQGELGRDTGWLLPAALGDRHRGAIYPAAELLHSLDWLVGLDGPGLFGRVHHARLLHGCALPADRRDPGGGGRQSVGVPSRESIGGHAPRRSSRPGLRRLGRLQHLVDSIVGGGRRRPGWNPWRYP